MITTITAYVIACDRCREPYYDNTVMFRWSDLDYARSQLTLEGWRFTADHAVCVQCNAEQRCAEHGHRWDAWVDCSCLGAIPEHREQGCPQLRWCLHCGTPQNRPRQVTAQ